MLLPQVSPAVSSEVKPRLTPLSKTSNRSTECSRSTKVNTAGPLNVQGAPVSCSAVGLLAGGHPPPQAPANDPTPPKLNWCQLPSTAIALAKLGTAERANT